MSKEQLVHRMMCITGMEEALKTSIRQTQDMLAEDMDEEMRPAFAKAMSLIDLDRIVNETALVIEDVYTEDELQALVDFYESPVGKKSIRVMPEITARGYTIGRDEFKRAISAYKEKHPFDCEFDF
jgi:hypothetical protein